MTDYQQDLAERLVRRRRRFSDDEKRHFLQLASQPGSSLSSVAQRYDLALSLLFRWRKEFGEGPAPFAGFAPVTGARDRQWPGDPQSAGPGPGRQVLRPHSSLPAGADLCPPRCGTGSLDARRLGRRRLLVARGGLLRTSLAQPSFFADDTPVPVLDPGRGR